MSTEQKTKCNECGKALKSNDHFTSLTVVVNTTELYDSDIDICEDCDRKTTVYDIVAKLIAAQQGEEE